ncbi:MAG: TonB-dependent receptor, partial [Steroidobacteraceae bacterium]
MSTAVAVALRASLVIGAALPAAVSAQDADEGAAALQEVQVTGSRIQRDGMTTPTPVTAVTADDLQILAPTTLGAAMTQLPQFSNSSLPEGAPSAGWTGSSGATFLNLRGVGANRTLVLLDTRRVVPSTRRGSLDVNLIPDALVKRVDVVTGGASAAYGSDAVSGVVNFILDTERTGLEVEAQGGITELGDNENVSLSVAGGLPIGDRMHLIASADWYHVDPIKDARDRDWWNSAGVITNPAYNAVTNPTAVQRLTRQNVRSRQFTQGGLILSGPFINQQFGPGGVLQPFVAGTDVTANTQVGGSGEDPSWYNYFTPETTRGSGFAMLNFDVTDTTRVFAQGLYGLNDTSYLSPPAGAQYGSWAATIYGDNAYLPQSIRQTMTAAQSFRLGRAGDLDYGGGKEIEQQNRLLSGTVGVKSTIGDWRLDGYYQYGRTTSDITMDSAIRLDRIYQAIDAVRAPNGSIVCRSTLTYANNGCVPMNVFGVGSPSAESIAWITQDISQKQLVQQHVADLAISGSPFRLWAGDVSVAGGVSWRREQFRQDVYPVALHAGTDMPVISPSLGYKGLPTVYSGNANIFERGPSSAPRGSYDVREAFIETEVPLLGETALSRSLSFNGAVRLANYEGSGNVWAWKAGIDWQVTDELRVRGTRSRDVRAGSLSERFDTSRGPGNVDDPLDNTPNMYPISVISGGNPQVNPELADTLTFGVVYRPAWIEGASFSVDAYDIDIKGAIGQLGAQQIVDQCFRGATQLCGYIERDASNTITLVQNLFINTDKTHTRGIDVESSYRRPISLFGGAENINVRLLATYIDTLETQLAGAAPIDRVGQTGLAGGSPEWQGSLSLGYDNGPYSATLQGRYIDSGLYDATWRQGVEIDDNTIASFFLTNLQLGYEGELTSAKYRVTFNVNNLFDKDPPLVGSFGFTGSLATN